MISLYALLAGGVATSASAAGQDNPPIRLLPTNREAARVRVLQNAFDNHPADDARARDYAKLKTIVQDFVVRQLDAAPAISDEALREQLRKVVPRFGDERPHGGGGLYVQSDRSWGSRSNERVWAVAYIVWLGTHGPGGTGVVIDCYVWEPGQTRLAGRRDRDFSGYTLNADWLASSQVGLLAYGTMTGSNGLGAWKAIVYFCDRQGVHAVWQTPVVSGMTAVARGDLIALKYAHPQEGAAGSAASWTYEVYVVRDSSSENPTVTLVSRETKAR
jgi:hypothetical protein